MLGVERPAGKVCQTATVTSADQAKRYVEAVPLAASAAFGLGPFATGRSRSPSSQLESMPTSWTGVQAAAETAGHTARQILSVLVWLGGSASKDELACETATADPAEVERAIDCLANARLVECSTGPGEGCSLAASIAEQLTPIGVSFAEQNAMTNEGLAIVCRSLGLQVPNRKQERIDAITGCFADPTARARIRSQLSPAALDLLESIADRVGPRVTYADSVGVLAHGLGEAEIRYGVRRSPVDNRIAPLAELTTHGILGLDSYERKLWIWREAWPLIERPLFTSWPSVPEPKTAPVTETGRRLAPVAAAFERALAHWDAFPPPVLKNGELRFSKPVLRSTAKALSIDEETIELVANCALSLGLLLPNVVKTTGTGRRRITEQAWLADPDMRRAWAAATANARLLRIISEWAKPTRIVSHQLVANRHLLLWELASLPAGTGWVDDEQVAAWCGHRYAPIGSARAVINVMEDLRRMGVVTASGSVALTEFGRLALEDPAAALDLDLGSADQAVVQADQTIVCPPDLDPDLRLRLSEIAVLESDAGALTFRLGERQITGVVQAGRTAAEILGFLDRLSSVPVADTVRTLVHDAAARAERVRVLAATTVVVTRHPADLITACTIKSAKLTALTDTVATSNLTAEKVQQALSRANLAPLLVTGGSAEVVARRGADDAAELEQRASLHRSFAKRTGHSDYQRSAEELEALAKKARDPSSKLAVAGPIAVTPALVKRAMS